MSKKTTVALAGIGGYGKHYLKALLDAEKYSLVAVADPAPPRR